MMDTKGTFNNITLNKVKIPLLLLSSKPKMPQDKSASNMV